MTRQPRVTRRRFLGAAAATAGGALIAKGVRLDAGQAADGPACPSTDHFWYRLQPEGPYIDSQCDNRAFGWTADAVCLSEDNARTWPHRVAFPDTRNITFSHLFKNGNVLFATQNRLFLSTDKLKTYRPTSPTPPSIPGSSTRSTNAPT